MVALSKNEAEFCEFVKGASQTKGIISMPIDFGNNTMGRSAHVQPQQVASLIAEVRAARVTKTSTVYGS